MRRSAYGPHRDHFGELWLPAGDGPHPIAVLLHGGFWRTRHRLGLMSALAADLAGRGWAAWNLEFRRVGLIGRGGYPETLDDVAAGIDHLAAIDAALDLGRVVAIGHSAGGQLALWAASRGGLAGVVGQAAVCDLEQAHRLGLGGGAVARFLGGAPAAVPERYRDASPAARLPLGVPTLLVHGERDDIVPVSLALGYRDAARAGGEDITLVLRSGDGHFEHIDPRSAAWAAVPHWLGRWE